MRLIHRRCPRSAARLSATASPTRSQSLIRHLFPIQCPCQRARLLLQRFLMSNVLRRTARLPQPRPVSRTRSAQRFLTRRPGAVPQQPCQARCCLAPRCPDRNNSSRRQVVRQQGTRRLSVSHLRSQPPITATHHRLRSPVLLRLAPRCRRPSRIPPRLHSAAAQRSVNRSPRHRWIRVLAVTRPLEPPPRRFLSHRVSCRLLHRLPTARRIWRLAPPPHLAPAR